MVSLIARTSAPAAATQNMFVNNTNNASTLGHKNNYETNCKLSQKLTFIQ